MNRSQLVLALLLCTLPLTSAVGQTSRQFRGGLWAEAGSGPSHLRLMSCSDCTQVDRTVGGAYYARAGVLLSDRVLLGIEAYGMEGKGEVFAGTGDSVRAQSSSLTVIAIWYPWMSGTFLKAGIGSSAGEVSVRPGVGVPFSSRSAGVGMTFAVGYDRPITRYLAITGSAGTWIAAVGDLVLPNTRVDDVISTTYGFTLGMTIR